MAFTMNIASTLAVLAVFCILLAGLWTMMRGTSPNRSQTLMRWRVALQFVAVVVIVITFWVKRSA